MLSFTVLPTLLFMDSSTRLTLRRAFLPVLYSLDWSIHYIPCSLSYQLELPKHETKSIKPDREYGLVELCGHIEAACASTSCFLCTIFFKENTTSNTPPVRRFVQFFGEFKPSEIMHVSRREGLRRLNVDRDHGHAKSGFFHRILLHNSRCEAELALSSRCFLQPPYRTV